MELPASINSSCDAREKKSRHFRAPVVSTLFLPSILNLCYFWHHRSLLNRTCERSIGPDFTTINSRIQEVHIFCDAWPFIVQPFLPFPRQSCPVEWLPGSRWYPQQKIIEEKKRSSEERIEKKRQLSCPLQTRMPSTWYTLEIMLWYINRIRLQTSGPRRWGGMPGRPCHIFFK